MSDRTDTDDVESYVLNSTYRSRVFEYLAGTPRATPKEIAEGVDVPRPHVSRALSELEETGVVELRVPESRTVGRYYGLTEKGTTAWPTIKRAVQNVDWELREPDTQALRDIVELARDAVGDGLRTVGTYDGETVSIWYIDPAVEASYTDEEFEDGLRTLIFDHSLDEVSVSGEDCWSDTLHFEEFSVVRIRLANGSRIAITFDDSQTISVPTFAEAVENILDGDAP